MSRIRSIKPDFWANEQVMECSPLARLVFIGMWNFCDDQGVHPASPKTLRAEVFPSDDLSPHQVAGLVAELIAQGLIREFQADGKSWWHVTGWHHQRIDRPSKSKYPTPPSRYESPAPDNPGNKTEDCRGLVECSWSPRDGREGKGGEYRREEEVVVDRFSALSARETEPRTAAPAAGGSFSADDVADLYHEVCSGFPRCDIQTAKKTRAHIETLLESKTPGRNPEKWRRYFEAVTQSALLSGLKPKRSGYDEPWIADLFWLVDPDNFAVVCSGKYHTAEVA